MTESVLDRQARAGTELRAEIGWALARARQEAGFTRQELAETMGYNLVNVERLERGEVTLTIGEVGEILAVMGMRLVLSLEPLEGEHADPGDTIRG